MPEPMAPVGGLRLEEVVAGYGAAEVLHGVSLDARPGTVTGLIGPNGSGKTTLVRVASRGLRPWSGEVSVAGVDPFAIPARQAARLAAVVPQDVIPSFSFSVLEFVLMGRAPYRASWTLRGGGVAEDWAATRHAMARANVQHLADRPVEDLSGGERRRVVLAQALAQETPVLLLDEPTTHLDVRHVIELLGLVRTLARAEGRTVVAIVHDLNLAASMCDRVACLSAGRVVADGTPAEVLTPTLIREVFGVEAEVAPSGAAGRPAIAVLPPLDAPAGPVTARAHVVGGAGRGAPAMLLLAERGYEVSTGVLHVGDTDEAAAERLGLLRVSVPPFSVVDDRAVADCLEVVRGADLLVVCDPPMGPGNVANLRMALDAARAGVRTVLLEQTPIFERDFTGGEASTLWAELARLAPVVPSMTALDEVVRALRPEIGSAPG